MRSATCGKQVVQHRVQRFISGRRTLDELQLAVCAAPVHAVQHRAVKVNVEVGRGVQSGTSAPGLTVVADMLFSISAWQLGRVPALKPRTARVPPRRLNARPAACKEHEIRVARDACLTQGAHGQRTFFQQRFRVALGKGIVRRKQVGFAGTLDAMPG